MSGLRYRWLVTDLDGTLVGRDLRIVPRSAEAVARYRSAGGEVVIATGRNEDAAGRFRDELGLETPMILYNGARVVAGDGAELAGWTLGEDWARLRADVLNALPPEVGAVAFVAGTAWIVSDAEVLTGYAARDRIDLLTRHLSDDDSVTKVMILAPEPPLDPLRDVVLAACPDLQVVVSERTYLEVLPAGVSKGAALRILTAACGVDLSEVAAIGDNPNDIDMLRVAGLGVAVGDGHADVRRGADRVVGRCTDGAVADAIELLGQ